MKEYSIEQKRNIAFAGHHRAGKTALVEAMLYNLGIIDRMGKTEDGTTYCDFAEEEKSRGMSIYTTIARLESKKSLINVLDLPGSPGFIGEVKSSIRVSDGAVFVLDAGSGVEVETERAWEYVNQYAIPRIVVINKLDKERTEFFKAFEQLNDVLKAPAVPFQLPIGAEADFKGVVDLIKMKAVYFDAKGKVEKEDDIPAELKNEADEWREKIMDFQLETDETVMEKYLEGEELTTEEISAGLKKGVLEGSCVPVFCASAGNMVGISTLMNAIFDYLPSPAERAEIDATKPDGSSTSIKPASDGPLSAYVFRTTVDPFAGRLAFIRVFSGTLIMDKPFFDVTLDQSLKTHSLLGITGKNHKGIHQACAGDICAIAKMDELKVGDSLSDDSNKLTIPPVEFPKAAIQMAFFCDSKAEGEKLGASLPRIIDEDSTLGSRRDPDTNDLVISGMGDMHLRVVMDRLKNQFGITAAMRVPKVAYKETITGKGEGKYRHKKQSGGRGQFGEVYLRLEPLPSGSGLEFVDGIVGGVIPAKFVMSVEKGVVEAMERGVVGGFPVVDVKATCFDGMTHPVDSSDIAFKIAGRQAFKQVAADCKPILLEPIMNAKITVPEEYMGDVISDMNTKRGKIMGMDPQDGKQVINAQVPLAEMFNYCIDLRSISQARGSFEMEFSHYDPVPNELAAKIVAEAEREKEEAD